jgi:diguanylate cyclase (GGDEF)-like protein
MLFWVISFFFLGLLVGSEGLSIRKLKKQFYLQKDRYCDEQERLTKVDKQLREEAEKSEGDLFEKYLFYDMARKMAPLFDRERLLAAFSQEIRHLGGIDDVRFQKLPQPAGYRVFKFGRGPQDTLYIKTQSKAAFEYLPYFVRLLELCSDKIKLYNKFQELSIHDPLTKIYNRRYFALRYTEEFERAKRLGLSMSFLMIDIDHFKKINDTYGHLAGDVVLRSVARMIYKTLREMDFIARFGGEEFSVILAETDKAGAIMVADRISARISRQKIRAFNEIINVTLSVGVAAYPQNTIHSDVLIEIADKALYKAKAAGRNRVAWF